ncbi:MAG: MFS transporter, partial [Bacteriovoracia bacterium]
MSDKRNLLIQKKFWPIFWTEFLGACNDNVFKNALAILITYRAHHLLGLTTEQTVALASGIFILPYFLFSAKAGQLADKFAKHRYIYWVKIWELLAMIIGVIGFAFDSLTILLFTLFMMGTQSTSLGPAKYSILPEALKERELLKGNAYVNMGTFVAILLGTLLGGLLIAIEPGGKWWVSLTVITIAALGIWSSHYIIRLKPQAPELKIDWDIVRPTLDILKMVYKDQRNFIAIIAISWFWGVGVAFLSILPPYGKEVLMAQEEFVTLTLAVFSIGIGAGSVLCEKISQGKVELGTVTWGSLGLTFFGLILGFIGRPADIP